MKKAVIYARASMGEDKQKHTPEMQIKRCMDYAKANGLKVEKVFVERASGKNKSSDRDVFQEVIKELESGDVLLVSEFDRIARILWLGIKWATELNAKGIDIVEADTGKSYRDQRLISNFNLLMADEEGRKISARTKKVLQGLKEAGKLYGTIPLGKSVSHNNDLVDNPKEMKMIDHIRKMREKGMKYTEIRNECVRLGYTSRAGKIPSQQTLSRWCEGVVVPKIKRNRAGRKPRKRLDEQQPSLYYHVKELRGQKDDKGRSLSYRKIANILNERGVRTSKGGKIRHTQVVRILNGS